MHLKNVWKTIITAILFFFSFAGIALGEDLTVTMLNVGQADSFLISTAGKLVLIDAGEQKTDVATQLKAKGINHLDLVVATHPHADHIGGMEKVVTDFDIKAYMDNGFPATTSMYNSLMEAAEAKVSAGEMKYVVGRKGMKLNLSPEAYFDILWPTPEGLSGTRSDINANSIVMKLTHGDVCFLFMGDSEAETEREVIPQVEHCTVLKASHHGSPHSSIPELLNKVTPEVALISCGLANKHGHPGPSTLENLQKLGTQYYRTDLQGEVTVISDGKKVEVVTEHAPLVISKININLSDVSVLRQLPGIGQKTAESIVAYREENGPFEKIEDVLNVATNSNNQKRLSKILPFITVEGGSTTGLIDPSSSMSSSIVLLPRSKMKVRVVQLRIQPRLRVVVPLHHSHIKGLKKTVTPPTPAPVPAPAPTQTNEVPPQTTATPSTQASGMININTADVATLSTMPGMSAKKAQAAVDHRNANGPFKSCQSLTDVSGIGKKTVEKLLSVCTVE